MHRRWFSCLILSVVLMWFATGCGTFMAHRMVQAPNTYPTWFAPEPPVMLAFHPNFLTNFSKQYVDVGGPPARLCYRVINPADYRLTVASTNWTEHGRARTAYSFQADLSGKTNIWTAHPKGTVVLLHGYALAQFSMMPWALRLAEDGWRCVLVDLRGHGHSTGKKIYYGLEETHDLSQLLDHLAGDGRLAQPVAAFGESYGAVMALRWKPVEPRVRLVVAVAPYAGLSNTVLNLRSQYAGWLPRGIIKAGLRQLPSVLRTSADQLDTTTELSRHPVPALFITADDDEIAPERDVADLYRRAAPGSKLLVVPHSTHEKVTYQFGELTGPILDWLSAGVAAR